MATATLIVLATVSAACQPFFGYYGAPIQDPTDHLAQMTEHARYSNLTGAVRPWVEPEWEKARELGLRVVVGWPHEFWLALKAGKLITDDLPMWCRPPSDWPLWDPPAPPGDAEGWCHRTAGDWFARIRQHQGQIAYMGIADEYDCGGVWYPITLDNCRNAAALIERNISEARRNLPGVFLHVNYTAMFMGTIAAHAGKPTAWRLPYYGISLSTAEYTSFDCYTPFEACARDGTTVFSVPALVAGMEKVLAPWQRILLIPRAFAGPFLGYAPTSASVVATGRQYYDLAKTHPRIDGMLAFIWFDLMGAGSGAGSVPAIRDGFAAFGSGLTGRGVPVAPTGVRFAWGS